MAFSTSQSIKACSVTIQQHNTLHMHLRRQRIQFLWCTLGECWKQLVLAHVFSGQHYQRTRKQGLH